MSDYAIRNAVAQRDEIKARIEKFERGIKRAKAQLIDIDKFISQWEKFSGKPADETRAGSPLKSGENSAGAKSGDSLKNTKKEAVAEISHEILQSVAEPLSRTDLFKRLQDKGVIIRGRDPEMILSTMLWRTKETSGIVRLKGGGYCLQGAANPEDMDGEQDSDLIEIEE